MDLEDCRDYAIIITGIILCILAFILPICIFCNIGAQRDYELEKYFVDLLKGSEKNVIDKK